MPEGRTDALNALKIDMVSVEKRLSQLGASELLQGLADLVSGAIKDLQVEAERKEGDNPSPAPRALTDSETWTLEEEGLLGLGTARQKFEDIDMPGVKKAVGLVKEAEDILSSILLRDKELQSGGSE